MIRFGGSPAEDEAQEDVVPTAGIVSGLGAPAPGEPTGREIFVRHARKDGRLVAILRGLDHGTSCTVEAEVYPHGTTQLTRPGPYTFADAHPASAFVTEAVAALMSRGCDIQAQ